MFGKLLKGLNIIAPHVEDNATVALDEDGNISTGFEGDLKVLLPKKAQDDLKELGWRHDYVEKTFEIEERAWIYPLE